jgi:hypothetical protein
MQHSHQPGKLKQQNKGHKKGRHESKSSIKDKNKGVFFFLIVSEKFK